MSEKTSVPDWLLERLSAGELAAPAAAELRSRLEADGELSRLSALEASNQELLLAHPPAAVAGEVARRAARQASRVPRQVLPVLALGGAAALVLALVSLDGFERGEPENIGLVARGAERPEQLTAKGLAPRLSIYRRTAASPERLSPNARVQAGDTLQLAYVAAGHRFGVVASVDARGAVTLHLPEQAGPAVLLDDRGETALPHAFELDATPGFERFVLVTSEAPFDTHIVVDNLAKKNPTWPPPLAASSVELEKSTL